MTNHQAGHDAEKNAADYLKDQGFKILELNWKTRYCEIDIVAEKNKTVYLIEVKSRKSASFGSGFDYITPKKLKQMTFAAEMWVANADWKGDYQLAALSIDAGNIELIEDLT